MTHALTAIRILSSLGSIWALFQLRAAQRKDNLRRATIQRLHDVIRGGR